MKTKILFICKYNRFRSKVAEAAFNKCNSNQKIVAKSAGVIKGSKLKPEIIQAGKRESLLLKGPPRGLTTALLKWQDIIVLVADDVPASLFNKYKKKLIIWKIKDTEEGMPEARRNIIRQIKKKVESLVDNLS